MFLNFCLQVPQISLLNLGPNTSVYQITSNNINFQKCPSLPTHKFPSKYKTSKLPQIPNFHKMLSTRNSFISRYINVVALHVLSKCVTISKEYIYCEPLFQIVSIFIRSVVFKKLIGPVQFSRNIKPVQQDHF